MFAAKISAPSLRDSVQSPDRKESLIALVTEIAEKIDPTQVLVHPPTHITKSGNALIMLKYGGEQPADFVRLTMLRLELLRTIAGETYAALREFVMNGRPLTDWHALNAETYGLGETRDSEKFAAARRSAHREAFWRGFASVFTFGATVQDCVPETKGNRLEFAPAVGVRDILRSALTPEGTLGNPEQT
jgi:hypothetical protein